MVEVATSVVPYLALSVMVYLASGVSLLLAIPLMVLAAGFLVRTFVVFHDCAHGSLFASRRANRWVGRVTALLVLAPFERWRHDHAVHHASSGNLDRRGVGDVITLTVDEYRARGLRGRIGYRLVRNPLVMFGLGPIVAMVIGPRIATRSQRPRLRHSVYLTDGVVLGLAIGLSRLIGWEKLLLVWGPSAMLAGSIGIWLFYVQHQFEDAYWRSGEEWAFTEAALSGSSHLALPAPLRFFTGSIGLHHVHHLNARIPSYNLLRAHRAEPVLAGVPSLTIWDGLRAINLKLWDQSKGKLVPFAHARVAAAEPGRH